MKAEKKDSGDDDFYSDFAIDELVDEDEISPSEGGFMRGWIAVEINNFNKDDSIDSSL